MGNHERSKSLTSRFTKTPNPCFHIKLENHYVCFTLKKMGPTGCTETSLTNYQSTLRNIPEEQRPQSQTTFFDLFRIRLNFRNKSLHPCKRVVGFHYITT